MESYSSHAWQIAHRPKKKRPILMSEKVQQAAESRQEIVAKAKSIVTKLTKLLTRTPQPTTFRLADLPDELQLYILSFAIPGRICHIMEGKIIGRYKIYKRHNPFCLAVKAQHTPLSLVCRKWQEMIIQLRPTCFTISEFGDSVTLQLGFNADVDTLLIPQWLLDAPGVEIENLTRVKKLIIAYTTRPTTTTLARIASLSPQAEVAFIHAAIIENATVLPRIPFLRPVKRLTPFGPFPHKDISIAQLTKSHLDEWASAMGTAHARIIVVRVTSKIWAGRSQGSLWYMLGKSIKDRRIKREFRKKEKLLDYNLRFMREMAISFLVEGELPMRVTPGLRKTHERHVRLMLHMGEGRE